MWVGFIVGYSIVAESPNYVFSAKAVGVAFLIKVKHLRGAMKPCKFVNVPKVFLAATACHHVKFHGNDVLNRGHADAIFGIHWGNEGVGIEQVEFYGIVATGANDVCCPHAHRVATIAHAIWKHAAQVGLQRKEVNVAITGIGKQVNVNGHPVPEAQTQ